MNVLILGRGKTGSLVADVARERGHQVDALSAADNPKASALTPAKLCCCRYGDRFHDSDGSSWKHRGLHRVRERASWSAPRRGTVNLGRIRQMVEKSGSAFVACDKFFCWREPVLRGCAHCRCGPPTRVFRPNLRAPSCAKERRAFGDGGYAAENSPRRVRNRT